MHRKADLMGHLNIQFSLLYISEHVLNLDENSSAPFGILEMLMILISAYCELMGVIHHASKITIMLKVPPG
jgi:hypothetical protein